PVYAEAARRLARMGLLYPCFCSRTDVTAAAAATDPDGAPLYPGICRHLTAAEIGRRLARGDAHQMRLRSEPAIARAGPLAVAEAMPTPASPVVPRPARPERWGDLVLQRKD